MINWVRNMRPHFNEAITPINANPCRWHLIREPVLFRRLTNVLSLFKGSRGRLHAVLANGDVQHGCGREPSDALDHTYRVGDAIGGGKHGYGCDPIGALQYTPHDPDYTRGVLDYYADVHLNLLLAHFYCTHC